jgi:hypothetical protein
VQICLFDGKEEFKAHKEKCEQIKNSKRCRYDVPTYLKFYSLYLYDRNLFRILLDEWLEKAKNRTYLQTYKKQKEIVKQCYVRDENGEPLRDCDEKYILSVKRLHHEPKFKEPEALRNNLGIHERLYQTLQINGIIELLTIQGEEQKPYDVKYKNYTFTIYTEERQAEIKGSWQLSIKERIMIHLKALRELRNGQN